MNLEDTLARSPCTNCESGIYLFNAVTRIIISSATTSSTRSAASLQVALARGLSMGCKARLSEAAECLRPTLLRLSDAISSRVRSILAKCRGFSAGRYYN